MDASKFSRTMAVLLTAVCLFFQQTLAFSLAKDFVIAQILYNILKPRIVPLPIPIPLPLKFVKHSFKPYAVPFYSHSLSAHQVGHSYDSTSGLGGLSGADYLSSDSSHLSSGHHDLSSSLSDISYGHDSLSSSLSEIPDLSTSYNLGHHDLSTSLSQISGFHLPSLPKTSYDHDLSIALSKLSAKDHDISDALSKYSTNDHNLSAALSKYSTDEHNLSAALSKYSTKDYDSSSTLSKNSAKKYFPKNLKSAPHNIQSILKELESESELLHEDSNHVDSIHDDIEAIGGLDILTDLDSLGENEKWW